MERGGYIYIMTNKNNTVIYTGVTSDLKNRILEHKEEVYKNSFTSRYNIKKLIYFEGFQNIEEAIIREKQIKAGSRQKKIHLINTKNPKWIDLFDINEEY
ncbi:GIY-YIG nuclease family protein [Bacteroidota bacterium]